ncbi:MAG: DUF4244 domain-containing protein [Actinomycetota bacterium]|nr:DUF4244 domain-containing protein [Actinomycetota bacterium]
MRPARPPSRPCSGRLLGGDPEAGMTTAEYAVGTVAACGFGGVLYKVVTSHQVLSLLTAVITRALHVTF